MFVEAFNNVSYKDSRYVLSIVMNVQECDATKA